MLMSSTSLSLNIYNHEGIVSNLYYASTVSDDNTKPGNSTPKQHHSQNNVSMNASSFFPPARSKTSFKQLEVSNRDLTQRNINQAQAIEELMKKQNKKESNKTVKEATTT